MQTENPLQSARLPFNIACNNDTCSFGMASQITVTVDDTSTPYPTCSIPDEVREMYGARHLKECPKCSGSIEFKQAREMVEDDLFPEEAGIPEYA